MIQTVDISALEEAFTHKSARPTVPLSIAGNRFLALFDSGAKITALNESVFQEISVQLSKQGLALKSVPIPPTYVISASSHKVLVNHAYFVPFYVENEFRCWRALVLSNLSSDVILGQDFLSFYGAQLCCRTHKISWSKPLRKTPPPEFCFTSIPKTQNRFDVLAIEESSPMGVPSFSLPSLSRRKRKTRERSVRAPNLENALTQAKQRFDADTVEGNCTFALSARDQISIPPFTSIRVKADLTSIGEARFPPLKRKTIGIVESDPILSSKKDVICLEGLAHAYLSTSSIPYTYVQLSNLSAEYKYFEKCEYLAAFSPLTRGSEIYDISVLKTQASSPIISPQSLTQEKVQYLQESVQISSPQEFRHEYEKLVLEFHDIFASSKDDIGHTGLLTHKIHLKNPHQAPVFKKQFPVPWAHQDFINKKVDDMLRQGIIEESYSPYNSPVFAVKKPHSDDLRLVVDLRHINQITHCTSFRVRCVQECVDEISQHNSSIFSTLDISQAFYQISLDKGSRPLTSFTIPGKGSFMFCKLPMGLHGSPASLSRVTNFIVRDLPSVIAYLDDLIAHSKDHVLHLDLLRQLFLRLRKYGLKLQAKKTVLGADSVVYLGYRISKNGIQPGEEKVEAIKHFPPPRTIKQIRQFCGLANYFRHMIPNFSRKSAQLTKLIQRQSGWRAGMLPDESLQAFKELQTDLSTYPVLAFPDPRKTFHVFTDGAIGSEREPGGLGAVLCQQNSQGILQPVAFASRGLQDNERNYSAFLIEMSAIVFAIQHWHTYLYGRFFFVYCDHKPIEKLSTVHKKTLSRLQELMLEYNFELKYNPGCNNGPADALSRNPLTALGTETDVPLAQAEDPFCEAMMKFLVSKILPVDPTLKAMVKRHATSCSISNDGTLLFHLERSKFPSRTVIVVPLSFQMPLIRAAHCSKFSGHLGVFKTVNRLFINYWWPGLQDQVTHFIKECETCQLSKTPPNFKREVLPSQPLPILDAFNQRVHIDTIGKMRGTRNPWLLVMTCAFSKYVVAVPIQRRDAETQAQAIFENWVCKFGSPKSIVHDGDPAYCGELFQKLCTLLGTKTIQISSYHCQSNGGVEVYNKVFQGILKSMLQNPTEPYEPWLPVVSLAYNSSVNQATNSSPFFLLYGCDPNLPQFEDINLSPYNIDFPAERFMQLKAAKECAKRQMKEAAEKNKHYYDRFAKECKFQVGERCLLHFPRTVCLQGHSKFFKPWHPVVVTRILNQTTYLVRRLGRTRAQRESMVHANRLKKFFPILIFDQNGQATPPGQNSGPSSPLPPPVGNPVRARTVRKDFENPGVSDSNASFGFDTCLPFSAPPAHGQRNDAAAAGEEDDFVHLQAPSPERGRSPPPSPSSSSNSSFASVEEDLPTSGQAAAAAPRAAAAPQERPPPSSLPGGAPAPPSRASQATAAAPAPAAAAAAPSVKATTAAAPSRSSSAVSSGRPVTRRAPPAVPDPRPAAPSAAQPRGRPGGSASLRQQAAGFLDPLAEGLYGPRRATRSNSTAPSVDSLPKRPLEYKDYKKRK